MHACMHTYIHTYTHTSSFGLPVAAARLPVGEERLVHAAEDTRGERRPLQPLNIMIMIMIIS